MEKIHFSNTTGAVVINDKQHCFKLLNTKGATNPYTGESARFIEFDSNGLTSEQEEKALELIKEEYQTKSKRYNFYTVKYIGV